MRPWICAFVALTGLLVVSPASADTTVFENGIWVISGPAEYDDVVIGEGALVGFTDGVIIHGNLEIENGGWCSLYDSLVGGNVKCRYAAIIDLFGSVIEGNVDVKRTGGEGVLGLLPLISIINCTIDGNLKITDNDVNSITVTGNVIRGQLQVKHNSYVFQTISGNTVRNRHCR